MMNEARSHSREDEAVEAGRPAFDDSDALSDTSVNRLLDPTETQVPLRSAIGIANGLAISLAIWLAVGAIVLVASLVV